VPVTGHPPALLAALTHIAGRPGCTLLAAAQAAGVHSMVRFDYALVRRAMRHGLVENRIGPRALACGSYSLYLTPAGWALIAPPSAVNPEGPPDDDETSRV
jgi:hypothetical protein